MVSRFIIFATSREDLQNHFDAVVTSSECLSLSISCKKTKMTVISKSKVPPLCQLHHGNTHVSSFNYLGSIVASHAQCRKEIRRRIGLTKDTFPRFWSILADLQLSIKLRIQFLKAYVWSTLLYCCESWTLTDKILRLPKCISIIECSGSRT